MSLHVHIHEHSHGEAVWGDREKPAWYNGKYVLMVKFNQLSPGYTTCSDKLYGYMTNNNTIRPGDFVAVMSPVTGVCAAEVVEVHERAAIAYNATKWIIGKIDLTEYNQHTERMKRLADLEKIIAQRKREIAAQMDLEMVASNSPQDEALVREFDSLRNWGS